MRNGITYNCKTLKHRTLLSWLICCLVANTALANSLSINVYLKLKPNNQVKTLIQEFNRFLEQHHLLSTYQITPYLDEHPLHVTLYMATYEKKQIPAIIKQAKTLAKQQQPISFLTSELIANKSGYVMLTLVHNEKIQELSHKTLNSLANLRDKKASIPTWAAQDPDRLAIFNQYGSPNVLNYFNPHFSVLSAGPVQQKQSARLYQQLQKLIRQFTQKNRTQVLATAYAIGVGIANSQGQIIKEMSLISLG